MDFCPGGRRELRRQLEENPDWESDLLALYGFDIWDAIDGRVPIRRVYALLDRLPHEPKSVWRAKSLGGPELKDYSKFMGWDANTYVMADLIDAVNQSSALFVGANTENNKVPDITPYPRPGKTPDKPTETLDDFGSKLKSLFGPGIAS